MFCRLVLRSSFWWRVSSRSSTPYSTAPTSVNIASAVSANITTRRSAMDRRIRMPPRGGCAASAFGAAGRRSCRRLLVRTGPVARLHHVAHAADRVQQLGREGVVDLGAQALDGDLDDVGVGVEVH